MEDGGGIEPLAAGLKVRCRTSLLYARRPVVPSVPPFYLGWLNWGYDGPRGWCRTSDLPVIGRAHRAAMLRVVGGRVSELNYSPFRGTDLQSACRNRRLYPPENWCPIQGSNLGLPRTKRLHVHCAKRADEDR